MKWRTEIGKIQLPIQLDYSSSCLLMGSCFADHIGAKLKRAKFICNTNPTGISYNPISILKHLTFVSSLHSISAEELKQHDSTYVHLDFHSQFSDQNKSVCLDNINTSLKNLADDLKTATTIFISIGSCIVFKEKETDSVVTNCHKLASALFEKFMLSQHETDDSIIKIVSTIRDLNPAVSIVFTISPIRHSRNGLIEDNRSKAQLISAVHKAIDVNSNCHYFPSYEIMKDDLRDYRFYKEDLVHPSEQAIAYIWECFMTACMNSETQLQINEIEKLMKQVDHRFLTNNKQLQLRELKKLRSSLSQHKYKNRFALEIEALTNRIHTLTAL
jgi:hypothetical protein